MWGRLHIKTTQMTPFFCGIPLFQSFLSLYIPLSFANFLLLQKKKKNLRRECGSSLHFYLYFYFVFFLISYVWKVICLQILAPLEKISWKEFKFETMKKRNASDDGERGIKKLGGQPVNELSSSQESSSTQSIREILRRGIEQKRVQQNEERFSRSQDKVTLSNWASILSNLSYF